MARPSMLAGYLLVMLACLLGWALAMQPPTPGHPIALAVVLCGAAGYVLCCHPLDELRQLAQPLATRDPAAARTALLQFARVARSTGSRGLEQAAADLGHDPVGQAGLRLVADGAGPLELDEALPALAHRAEAAAWLPVELWSSIARGTLHAGALLSLVQMSWALLALPAAQSTYAVAASLSGTAYGLAIAWLLAQPRIVQARRAARRVAEVNRLWLAGWRAIAEGVHPLRLEDRLNHGRAA